MKVLSLDPWQTRRLEETQRTHKITEVAAAVESVILH